ncbi:response regulator [Tianweitania sp. BSSL-BM11]|uniref:Response regulator n=1 Tax=Tianweitania aestuarii TaxID=2814886 RepID=A0ABS5RVA0_9HYPH|nr:response regulator [Tianweitania aestuarii]MBS9720149.1 response regulator [Tianweitania aestuarii]
MSDDYSPFALVVDDDVFIRMDAASILEDAGFRTYQAGTAAEAIEILHHAGESIQLLFSDVVMPGGRDGFWLARECSSRWPHIGILLSSGHVRPKPGDLPAGAEFVDKPFSAEIVQHRVSQILPDGAKPEPLKAAVAR